MSPWRPCGTEVLATEDTELILFGGFAKDNLSDQYDIDQAVEDQAGDEDMTGY